MKPRTIPFDPPAHPRMRPHIRRHMRGVSIITGIFLLVVLALLATAIVSVTSSQNVDAALDVQGVRAYHAARAGVEWGLYRQLQPSPQAACFAPTTFAMPSDSALAAFTVTVQCTLTTGPGTLKRFTLISTACNQPSPTCPNPNQSNDYVQRVVQVEF